MKIDFIKELKATGDAIYFTRVDGKFIDGSMAFDEIRAKVVYNNIVKNKGKLNFETIIESIEIE